MGFFSSILKGLGTVVGAVINPGAAIAGLFGGDKAAATAIAPATQAVSPVVASGLGLPGSLGRFDRRFPAASNVNQPVVQLAGTDTPIRSALTGALTALGALGLPLGVAPLAAGVIRPPTGPEQLARSTALMATGGNGQFAKRTIVQTINLATGQVVKQDVLIGAPFLMNKAVAELRRTTRKLMKANAKIPRRTAKQSLGSELKDAALKKAIDMTNCPPKC